MQEKGEVWGYDGGVRWRFLLCFLCIATLGLPPYVTCPAPGVPATPPTPYMCCSWDWLGPFLFEYEISRLDFPARI